MYTATLESPPAMSQTHTNARVYVCMAAYTQVCRLERATREPSSGVFLYSEYVCIYGYAHSHTHTFMYIK